MPEYTLPDLPYDYGALEPHYSAEILELHHDKHHATYVKGANTALEKLAAARENEEFGTINQLQKNLAFNLSGHVLHSLFWKNMSPDGGDKPDGEIAAAIDESFGTFEGFRNQLSEASLNVQGSGWGALTWEPVAQRLIVEQVYDHQSNVGQGAPPLLVLDMWEHAYYLQYKNVKADWVKSFWENLSPDGGGKPEGDLAAAIDQGFGTFEGLRSQLTESALNVQGSGWGALAWEPTAQRLIVEQVYDHQSNVGQGSDPVLVIDAWEHAFYLQYQNRKTEFFDAIWNVWNWKDASERFDSARRVDLELAGVSK